MEPLPPVLARIQAALHPLHAPPAGPCWNIGDLAGLLPPGEAVPAAVLIGLVPRPAGLQVLLTRRNGSLRLHAGQVSFPGGRVDAGDADACAAALRETVEEVGLLPSTMRPLGYLDPLATITGFRVLPLVSLVTPDYIARPDPREVDEVFEVPFAFLMAPENLVHGTIDVRGVPRPVLEYADADTDASASRRRIWGASASMLFNLRHRLETTR